MSTTTMGDLFARAEADGFSGKDMPHGEFDVRVKSAKVRIAKKTGQERITVTFEALSGLGTCQDGSNFNPDGESHYFWFKFLSNFIDVKEFFTNFQAATVTDTANAIQQLADGQQLNLRINLQAQVDNPDYNEVAYLGPATGVADVLSSGIEASTPVASPVDTPTAAAFTPPPAPAAPPDAQAEAAVAAPSTPASSPAAPDAAVADDTEVSPWDE